MILRDRCSTSYDLASLFHTLSWQAQYFRQVDWKNRKTHWYEAVSSALNFPFLKEVSQNGFVFDVVNFEKLDDGWPESVEEQGLLLLVWRRNFRNDI